MPIKDKNLYYVGGVVRDEILGIESFDIDYCYEGNAIEFTKNFNVIRKNPDFGTVKICINNKEIDIASTREEHYPKLGHLPVVKNIGCALKNDLKRRDFTINALAKNTVSNEIVDFFNGLDDLKNKKIRILHDLSFIEDPSRILRALKFATRFGFEMDRKTEQLQQEYLNNINYDMSYHRIKKELKETFNLNKEVAYKQFIEQGIYKLLKNNQVIQKTNHSIEKLVQKYSPNNVWLVYLGIFDLSNLDLTKEESNIVNLFYKIKDTKPNGSLEIYNTFKNIPLESIILYALYVNYDIATEYLDKLRHIQLEINGEDLKKIGIPQGKIYNEIFEFVLEHKLKTNLNKTEELEIVKRRFL